MAQASSMTRHAQSKSESVQLRNMASPTLLAIVHLLRWRVNRAALRLDPRGEVGMFAAPARTVRVGLSVVFRTIRAAFDYPVRFPTDSQQCSRGY